MQTPPTDPEVAFGFLQADGTIRLDRPPQMPPGPIQIVIRSTSRPHERLPDFPLDDASLSPTFVELPRSGVTQTVQPVRVLQRLPNPFQSVEAT
jgi:hypothetical protein